MGKTFVVGIAGGSASGKSTFCSKIENGLGQYKKADLILNGSNPSELAETAIIKLIRNRIQE